MDYLFGFWVILMSASLIISLIWFSEIFAPRDGLFAKIFNQLVLLIKIGIVIGILNLGYNLPTLNKNQYVWGIIGGLYLIFGMIVIYCVYNYFRNRKKQ